MPSSFSNLFERPRPFVLWLVLLTIGVAWGLTGPLSKTAISTGHNPIGVTFWNTAIGAAVLSAALLLTRVRFPFDRRHVVFFLVCGLLGTALPNTLSYTAYKHLPVGVMVTVIALVPMATLLMARPLGIERIDPRRLLGLVLGAVAVLLIVLPETSLPEPGQAVWVVLPVVISLSYAAENVYIALTRPEGCGTLTIMCGLSWGALLLLTPTLVAAGAWFDITEFGPPEQAIIAISALHLCAYSGFIWLIGHAGPVFAAQVGYVVTGSGVMFGMILFDERHSSWIWLAIAMMLAGIALVQPRK